MGGYRINGCGWSDHFSKLRDLGIHMCPTCKQLRQFYLETAKKKIDVFFIPTVTLESRYAVMCNKCKTGRFCSESWKDYLLTVNPIPEIIFEDEAGVSPETEVTSQQQPVPMSEKTSEKQLPPNMDTLSTPPRYFTCTKCGITQFLEGNFCSYCGTPVPQATGTDSSELSNGTRNEKSATTQNGVLKTDISHTDTSVSVCPVCGHEQQTGAKYCGACGAPLETSPRSTCPNCGAVTEAGMLFCFECGHRL
ncbi:MAG: zinc ribbon domain-containing protein [Oscillibacter sp.]|nr:zinc ribbon domain-containing protein [Oscillibacter sp.]